MRLGIGKFGPKTLISYDLKGESMAKLVDVVLCHRTNQFVTLRLHVIIKYLYDFTSLFRMLFSWTKLPLHSQLDFFNRLQLYNRFLRCVLGFLIRMCTICSITACKLFKPTLLFTVQIYGSITVQFIFHLFTNPWSRVYNVQILFVFT